MGRRRCRAAFAALAVILLSARAVDAQSLFGPSPVSWRSTSDDIAQLRDHLATVDARLAAIDAERADIEQEHESLDATQLAMARQLEAAMHDTRVFAVEAYVAGGPHGSPDEAIAGGDPGEVMWRSVILSSQAAHGLDQADVLADLLARADVAVREIAQRSDQNKRKLEAALLEHFLASIALKRAEQLLAQERAPLLVVATDVPAGSLAEAWARLRQCESGGNYRAVSPGGLYRGAYQFDLRTWQGVGGVGDPIDAPPEEQDLRAQILYESRGRQPWPVCGRFLP